MGMRRALVLAALAVAAAQRPGTLSRQQALYSLLAEVQEASSAPDANPGPAVPCAMGAGVVSVAVGCPTPLVCAAPPCLPLPYPGVAATASPAPATVPPPGDERNKMIEAAIEAGDSGTQNFVQPAYSRAWSVKGGRANTAQDDKNKEDAIMENYIASGQAGPSGFAGPVGDQPVMRTADGAAVTPGMGQVSGDASMQTQRLVADESAIATLTKDVNELLTANQYLMNEAALARPGPPGPMGPPGPPGPSAPATAARAPAAALAAKVQGPPVTYERAGAD